MPAFDRTFVLFPYDPPIPQFIFALKFHHQLYYANTFGQLFLSRISKVWYKNQALPDMIIPVPLHRKRLRERGFNQSLEIAKFISKSLNIPLDIHGVKRIKNTQAQSGLKLASRKQNLERAFTTVQKNRYAHLTIAILDDVMTTGYTVRSLAQTLKMNGAEKIHVWCCARRG